MKLETINEIILLLEKINKIDTAKVSIADKIQKINIPVLFLKNINDCIIPLISVNGMIKEEVKIIIDLDELEISFRLK